MVSRKWSIASHQDEFKEVEHYEPPRRVHRGYSGWDQEFRGSFRGRKSFRPYAGRFDGMNRRNSGASGIEENSSLAAKVKDAYQQGIIDALAHLEIVGRAVAFKVDWQPGLKRRS